MEHFRADNLGDLEAPELTEEGTLVTGARLTRAGVFTYVRRDEATNKLVTVRELRPRDEVARADSIKSLELKSLTLEHPRDKDGWKVPNPQTMQELHVGEVLPGVVFEPETDHVRGRVTVRRADAIAAVMQKGWRQLSALYRCRLERTSGVDPEFGPYDVIQRDIKYNGVGIVRHGRAGDTTCLRADHAMQVEETELTNKESVMGVVIGGRSYDCTEELASAVQGLQGTHASAALRADKAEQRADAAEAERDAFKLRSEKSEAQRADSGFDGAAYAELREIERVAEGHGVKAEDHAYDGGAIKRAVVAKALGDQMRADASDVYMDASFDLVRSGVIAPRNESQRTQAAGAVNGARTQRADEGARSMRELETSFVAKLTKGDS